jgi:hypothetical protein
MNRALAPANPSFAEFAFRSDFFTSLFIRADKRRSASAAADESKDLHLSWRHMQCLKKQ